MEPRLIQQQTQKLILSPQIRQYLKILQLPVTDLQQAIHDELNQNPLLEEKSSEESDLNQESPSNESSDSKKTEEIEFEHHLENLIDHSGNYDWEPSESDFSRTHSSEEQELRDYQESLITKEQNLADFLEWQISFLDMTIEEKRIAEEIIGNLNDDGFLTVDVAELATTLNIEESKILKILASIQELDPPGVAARSLQECLALQLRRNHPEVRLALDIVETAYEELVKRSFNAISKKLNTSLENVKTSVAVISSLEPKPGRAYAESKNHVVIPDVIVSFADEKKTQLKVDIPNEYIPELRINGYYRKLLRDKSAKPETKAFVKEKMQAALNFINALSLRKSTLRNISDQIVMKQPTFFVKGFSHLNPLRLRDIADELGVHESTVSRAISGKYMSTPQGTVPFKSFFSNALESTDGDFKSQKSIIEKIRNMIEKEDPSKPLSDQAIATDLKKDGLKIARRTVAKYRELLKILPSHMRRQK